MKQLGKAYAPWLAETSSDALSVRKSNTGKTRIKSTAYGEKSICCCVRRRQGNTLVPAENRASLKKPVPTWILCCFPPFPLVYPCRVQRKQSLAPGGSDGAGWSPSRLQRVPRRCSMVLRPRNSLLALHAINFHEWFNPTLTEAVGHLSILSSRTWIRAYLSFHYIPYL